MPVRKLRVRGAAIRAAIQKMPLTELLALRRDLGTVQPGQATDADLPETLRAFDATARLALLAAFHVGGTNGGGPKHLPIGATGVVFTSKGVPAPFLPPPIL